MEIFWIVEGGEERFYLDISKLTLGCPHHLPHIFTIKVNISIEIYEKSSYISIKIQKKLRVLINVNKSK
jgi:hypothetical protein